MDWLNYHHLYYFWTVAREGSVAAACAKLHLAQPTISGQLRALERSLNAKLFDRAGRGLVLTDTGRIVYSYAEEIFGLGQEMVEALAGCPAGRPIRLRVGVADVLAKGIAHRLIQPALELSQEVHITCQEDRPDRLLAELSLHNLDVVLSDRPLWPSAKVKAYNHLLGECGVSVLGGSSLVRSVKQDFPRRLHGMPMLLPMRNTLLRRMLDQFFEQENIRPKIVGEFDDSALTKAFGQAGAGLFVAPEAIEDEVAKQYQVRKAGTLPGVRERFYAISVERRLKHPAVIAICESARHGLFAGCQTSQAEPALN